MHWNAEVGTFKGDIIHCSLSHDRFLRSSRLRDLEIKADDAPVKGPKRGKGKKDKKRLAVDPFEKKKPKLDELKVEDVVFVYVIQVDI